MFTPAFFPASLRLERQTSEVPEFLKPVGLPVRQPRTENALLAAENAQLISG
jgi:hypothetical protein